MKDLIKEVAIGTTKRNLNGLYLPIRSIYKNGRSWLKDSIQNECYEKKVWKSKA